MPSKYRSLITLRIENETKQLLKNLMKDVPDGVSRLLRKLIFFYITQQKNSNKISLEIKQEIKNYLNEKRFEEKKQKHKRKLFCYYLINNTLKTIYKLTSSHLINSGELNMNIINKVIDSAEEVFNTYPDDIKNDLNSEFDNLKLLKNRDNLIKKMNMLKLIKMKKELSMGDK